MGTEEKENFERRVQSIAQAIILALLLWVGWSMVDLVKSVTRLEVKGEQTVRDVSDIKTEMLSMKAQINGATVAASNAAAAAAAAAATKR